MYFSFLGSKYIVKLYLVDNSWRKYAIKIVPLHYVRKQAALVARCSNKFGISLVCTAFAYRKRGELLDGELSFSMTRENERLNGKIGGFFYRLEDEKRFSTVLSVRFS